jgi:hypothetical protein
MREPQFGAHLVTPRWGFDHHGIYAGGGRVIQYTGFKGWLRIGPVEEVSLQEFTRGRGYRISAHRSGYHAEEVVARARSRLGENLYRLLSNNCEHFAEWCVSGVSRSLQVERWLAVSFEALRA